MEAQSSVELAKMWTSGTGATVFIIVFAVFAVALVALLLRRRNR
ncbi:hypothetical protein [Streptomyces candidus]|uniref:Uncharacterized protein n=1 Tax=Streptomyces candidus TaxID=67283 RepID=A0A7X0HJ36_9ACTN|nr:hypothetical protein [Streptomyces candidus]MBB6438551.1 hypothetical protein [Streptomyces candidus]GHH45492.1 hypothetical protein GCM10018773_35010 [Streptomyces candidus]